MKKQDGLFVSDYDAAHLLDFVEYPLNAITVSVTPSVCFLLSDAAFA